jgi:hypothetical protein
VIDLTNKKEQKRSKEVIWPKWSYILRSYCFIELFFTKTVILSFGDFLIFKFNVVKKGFPVSRIKVEDSGLISRRMIFGRLSHFFVIYWLSVLKIIKKITESNGKGVVFV